MRTYDPAKYGDGCYEFYEQIYPAAEPGQVRLLADLAAGGRVLELGLATGRVARPLGLAGLRVVGIEVSASMVAKCRSLTGSDAIEIIQGDFCESPFANGSFQLVFALKNSLSLLPSIELVYQTLAEVSRVLKPGGTLLYETFFVDQRRGPSTYEHAILTSEGPRKYRVTSFEMPPGEIAQIAADAGLSLVDIWKDWYRHRTSGSTGQAIMIFTRQ